MDIYQLNLLLDEFPDLKKLFKSLIEKKAVPSNENLSPAEKLTLDFLEKIKEENPVLYLELIDYCDTDQ